jgi:hypothetical protein
MKFIPYFFVRSMKKMVQKFWVQGSGLWVVGSGFRVLGCGFWVQGSGFWVVGSRFESSPSPPHAGFWVVGSGFWVQRFGVEGSKIRGSRFPPLPCGLPRASRVRELQSGFYDVHFDGSGVSKLHFHICLAIYQAMTSFPNL